MDIDALEARAANTLLDIYAELPDDATLTYDHGGVEYRGVTLYLGINCYDGPNCDVPVVPDDDDINYEHWLYQTWEYPNGYDDFNEENITDETEATIATMLDNIKQRAIDRFLELAADEDEDEDEDEY